MCFCFALAIGFYITQSGIGVSPDSAHYISIGENLYHGRGFWTSSGGFVFSNAAPLFPLLITSLIYLGLDALDAARLIPIISFSLLIPAIFFIGKNISHIVVGYVACLFCLAFYPLLLVTSYAWTEMLFILFSALAVLALVKFVKRKESGYKILCLGGFFVALAVLTRFVGVALVLTWLIVIVVKNKSRLKSMIYQSMLFGMIACVPILPWLYRNLTLTGALQGAHWGSSSTSLASNYSDVATAISRDFLAPMPLFGAILSLLDKYILLMAIAYCLSWTIKIAVIALVQMKSKDKKIWLNYLSERYVVMIYAFIYVLTILTVRTLWFSGIGTRYMTPSYPFIMLAVLPLLPFFYGKIKNASLKPVVLLAIIFACTVFFSFQAIRSIGFAQSARMGQQFNSIGWQNSQMVTWAEDNIPANAVIYSDIHEPVYLRLRRDVIRLPVAGNDKEVSAFLDEIENKDIVLVLSFDSEIIRPRLLSNQQIEELGELVVVAEFPEGKIWQNK